VEENVETENKGGKVRNFAVEVKKKKREFYVKENEFLLLLKLIFNVLSLLPGLPMYVS
jgi:hypothetical protein